MTLPDLVFTGHPSERLPGHVSFCAPYIEGEAMLLLLNHRGVCAASGSSCASEALKASHVLQALGIEPGLANGSAMFSFGAGNSEEDVDFVLEAMPPVVERLRAMSPLAPGGAQ